jgi:hypothetical protein
VLLRKRSPLPIVGAGLLLVGTGYGVLLLGAGIATAVAMMALLTLGEALYKTTATAYVADQAPDHLQGRFQSLYAGSSISGVVLAAPLGGALYEAAPNALWPMCTALGLAAGTAALLASRHAPAPAQRRAGDVPEGARPQRLARHHVRPLHVTDSASSRERTPPGAAPTPDGEQCATRTPTEAAQATTGTEATARHLRRNPAG